MPSKIFSTTPLFVIVSGEILKIRYKERSSYSAPYYRSFIEAKTEMITVARRRMNEIAEDIRDVREYLTRYDREYRSAQEELDRVKSLVDPDIGVIDV